MNATQCQEAAVRLRDSCLLDPERPDQEALEQLLVAARTQDPGLAAAAASALIGTVVEELSDRFNRALAACYVNLFSRAMEAVSPRFSAEFVKRRYRELAAFPARPSANPNAAPEEVIVLSRITLGADIAVTSVFLDALHTRFPHAVLWLAGPEKNFALFAGLGWVKHWPLNYPRGASLAARLAVADAFEGAFDQCNTWLMDPDSRISQLGLLPIAPLNATLFFESRTWDEESQAGIGDLASLWCAEHLGVPQAAPRLAPTPVGDAAPSLAAAIPSSSYVCVSLGVGNNQSKRMSAAFEARLLRLLGDTGLRLVIDAGAGGAEGAAVRAAIADAGLQDAQVQVLEGSFAEFCRVIQGARFYVGYDSAGQHAAAALGVPGITLFKGFASEKMFQRWQPRAVPGARVIRVDPETTESAVESQFAGAMLALL